MASSGQAFNSLSYGTEGMELSSNLLLLPSCLLWVPILVYFLGKERLGQDGLQQWMEMWSMSSSRGLILQLRWQHGNAKILFL